MYSPPLDGFSPPPMSDFSPPPLSDLSPLRDFPPPINGFSSGETEEEDGEYNFGLGDTQYDLTGLSDKINILQLEKMKSLPPREILELKRESSELFPREESQDFDTAEENPSSQARNSCALTSQDDEDINSVEAVLEDNFNGNVSEQEAICDNKASDETDCDNAVIESEGEQLQPAAEETVLSQDRDTADSEDDLPVAEETTEQDNIKTDAGWESGAPEDEAEDVDTCWGEFPEDDTGNASESWSNFPPAPSDEWSLPVETNSERQEDRGDLKFEFF